GYADYILKPDEMPEVLLRYAKHPYVRDDRRPEELLLRHSTGLQEILTILRTRARHEFGGYKKPTLARRVQRRMSLHHVTKMDESVRTLRQSAAGVSALADDMMIHVTGFFRDPLAWDAVREKVIDPLVATRDTNSEIRVWTTACSSGEEAYTLGIL